MAEYEMGGARFEISNVISRTFESIREDMPLYLGLSVVLSGVPTVLATLYAAYSAPAGIELGADAGAMPPIMTLTYWIPTIIAFIVSLVTTAVLQAALTRATVLRLKGEAPQFGACLALGLSLLLPLAAIILITWVALTLAGAVFVAPYIWWVSQVGPQVEPSVVTVVLYLSPIIALLIPALYLWLCWCVVVPAYVQEQVGLAEAFARSWALTRGVRFRIFLTMLMLYIGLLLLSIPVGLLMKILEGGSSPLMPALVQGLANALMAMVGVAILASTYVELREVKEGIGDGDLEAIFD